MKYWLFLFMIYFVESTYIVRDSCSEEIYYKEISSECDPVCNQIFDCSGEYPIINRYNFANPNCSGVEPDLVIHYNETCDVDGYKYSCAEEIKELEKGYCELIFYEDETCETQFLKSEIIHLKENSCNTLPNGAKVFINNDNEYIRFSKAYSYNNTCNGVQEAFPLENNGSNCFQFDHRYATVFCKSNLVPYKYFTKQYLEATEDSLKTTFIESLSHQYCYNGGMREVCYPNNYKRQVMYDNSDCTGDINNVDFITEDISVCKNNICSYCSDRMLIIPDALLTFTFTSNDNCENNMNIISAGVHTMPQNCRTDARNSFGYYLNQINNTHFNYQVISGYSDRCDFNESGTYEYYKCLFLPNTIVPYKYSKSQYFIDSIPKFLDEGSCDEFRCVLEGNITLNGGIDVNVELLINSTLRIFHNQSVENFHVDKDGFVDVNGTVIEIFIESEEEYIELADKIESNSSFSLTVISGNYKGEAEFQLRAAGVEDCRKISSSVKNEPTKLSIAFKLDNSECSSNSGGIKWWIPLLIVEGIVVVGIVVFIILVTKVKSIRSFFLPYQGT